MGAQITKQHIDFLAEAIEMFNEDPSYATYRNMDNNLIALRLGEKRDSIQIYEINEVATFVEQLPSAPSLVFENEVSEKPSKLNNFMYALMKEARKDSLMEFLETWEISALEYNEIEEWFWKEHKVNL